MTAIVKCFTYAPLNGAWVTEQGTTYMSPGMLLLPQPYLGRQTLPVGSIDYLRTDAATAPENTRVLMVEVQDGKRIYYEVQPAGREFVVPSANSPSMFGTQIITFGPGWRFACLEAA
jgi:hypothetical protein